MNKKILSLFFLLVVLLSVTVSYAYFNQLNSSQDHQTDTGDDVDDDTMNNEIDSTLLDEDEEIEIGDMI